MLTTILAGLKHMSTLWSGAEDDADGEEGKDQEADGRGESLF